MKITFLGTGSAFSTATRGNFCVLLPEEGILIDTSPDVLHKLKKINYPLQKLKYVLITHLHGDHSFGVTSLACCAKYVTGVKYKIIAGDGAGEALSKGYKIFWSGDDSPEPKIEVIEIKDGEHDFKDFKLSCITTSHSKKNFSYRIEIKGKTIVCSGDTNDDTTAFAKNADVYIADSTYFRGAELAKEEDLYAGRHGTAIQAINQGKAADARLVALGHISEDAEAHIDEICKYAKEKGVRIVIPNDFETIEI